MEDLSQTEVGIKYKIGDPFEASFNNWPFPGPMPGCEVGNFMFIWNDEHTKKLARFKVTEWDGNKVKGVIVNTYGHKRRGG